MSALAYGVLALSVSQGLLMSIDEWVFHRRRGVPRLEAWGHPLDSLLFLLPLSLAACFAATPSFWFLYIVLAVISCLVITKDEWIHQTECSAGEHWIHAMLFILHPCVLWGVGSLWQKAEAAVLLQGLPVIVFCFTVYQCIMAIKAKNTKLPEVNNAFYETLGTRWYEDDAHAIALLRVESQHKLLYVDEILALTDLKPGSRILDIGCGAGFIANPLGARGYEVKGVDLSENSVKVAREHIPAGAKVIYEAQNAYELKESDGSYDAVLMLDFLEHVDQPQRAIAEAARVLKKGGLLIFHTFNRTPLSWLLAIHGIQFVTKDCPSHVHVYHLFLKPGELQKLGEGVGLKIKAWRGIRPKVFHGPFFWSLLHRRVHPNFQFEFCTSLQVGYLGYFQKG